MVRRYQVLIKDPRTRQYSIEVNEGAMIEEIIKAEGLPFPFPCNGFGTCGKCRVKIVENSIQGTNPPTPSEELYLESADLKAGIRLACQTKLLGPITLEFPESPDSGNILSDGNMSLDEMDPLWKRIRIEEPAPLNWENISRALACNPKPDLDLLRALPEIPEDLGEIAVEILDDRVVAITSCHNLPPRFAVAVDIGTTTLVAYLIDFESGRVTKTASAFNPQSSYGADLISRIEFASQPGGLAKLNRLIIDAINKLIDELVLTGATTHDNILQINLAGNTCMIHLLLNINPVSLGRLPFEPVFKNSMRLTPTELDLTINKSGLIYILPGIGGFVGADIAAGLLACKLSPDKYELFLDIGTNAEIVITGQGKILACSTAAGPAFEGARISCGMPAKSGAITDLHFVENEPVIATVNNCLPVGICGTGLIRIIVALLKKGVITETGKFSDEISDSNFDAMQKRYYITHGEEKAIFISQQDIREFQLAKAAIRAGLEIMMNRLEITYQKIERLYLSGAFGTYLKPEDAIFLGLLPEIPIARIIPAGNTAGIGTVTSILSKTAFAELKDVVKRIEHVELGLDSAFSEKFTEAIFFSGS